MEGSASTPRRWAMPRRRGEDPLHVHRAHRWVPDAEWRWQRAVRLLLGAETLGPRAGGKEASDGECRGVCARVSTDRQAESQTIEQQVERLQTYAQQQGWSLAAERIYQ